MVDRIGARVDQPGALHERTLNYVAFSHLNLSQPAAKLLYHTPT